MPQLTVELSANVIEKNNLHNFLQQCNDLLKESLPTDLYSCKSRTMEYSSYCIGDGNEKNAFIHLSLQVMPGRTAGTLNKVGEGLLEIAQHYFQASIKKLHLQITLEITELAKTYFKITN